MKARYRLVAFLMAALSLQVHSSDSTAEPGCDEPRYTSYDRLSRLLPTLSLGDEVLLTASYEAYFGERWGLGVVSDNERYTIVFIPYSGGFWSGTTGYRDADAAGSEDRLQITTMPDYKVATVSKAFAQRLVAGWRTIFSSPEPEPGLYIDGVAMTFAMPDTKCGYITVTRADFEAAEMESVLLMLARRVEKSRGAMDRAFEEEIEALIPEPLEAMQ